MRDKWETQYAKRQTDTDRERRAVFHSISILTNISTQFLLQSVCVCVCVSVCVCSALLYVNCFGRTMLYMCIEYHM